MLQRSARVVYDNQASYDSMMMMVNQLKKNLVSLIFKPICDMRKFYYCYFFIQEIKAIKKCYPMISFCSPQQKLQLYTQLFEKAIEIFSRSGIIFLSENK